MAEDGSGTACRKHVLAHLLPARAGAVVLQRLQRKCARRKRHPHAAGCSGAPPFGLSALRAFPLGSVEEKQGFLGYQVIVSVLDLHLKVRWRASWKCVAAVQKVSLDSWLRGYDL